MPEYRVVPYRGGLVSLLVMHLPVRFSAFIAAVLALGVCAGVPLQAQESSSQSAQPQGAEGQGPINAPYVSVNPLAKVRYDNRWDLSLGPGYDHMKAGPNLLQGANLGGLDMNGSFWLTRNWGIESSGRAYMGTSGTAPNAPNNIRGPVVKEYYFVGGAEWLGPHNQHGALLAHAMFGGVYGNFQKDLLGQPPENFDFYNNQIAPAAIVGGHMDLSRSEHWVFRITPDAIIKRYSLNYGPHTTSTDVNFAISVGMEYKFTKIKRSTDKKKNWVSGW
jgi:hypothetical protein